MMYEMRKRKLKFTLLLTRGIFNLPHHINMVSEELAFGDAGSYTHNLMLLLLVGCCFMSWQHRRSYQDGVRLATVHTPGDVIALPPLREQACYPTQSYYPDTDPTSPCHNLIMPVPDYGLISSNPIVYKNGGWVPNLFGHPVKS